MTRQYLDMLEHILENGVDKGDRTGVGTIGVFGYENRYDLSEGFPLLTTKKMFTRGIFEELIWFLSGDTNIRTLLQRRVNIWNDDAYAKFKRSEGFAGETRQEYLDKVLADEEFARTHGDLGPVYGKQWRDAHGVDQILEAESLLKRDPNSRRNIVSAWDPARIKDMAVPPCHVLFQWWAADGKLSCKLYQRSADAMLGVPFNIASYAALIHMMASTTGLEPGEFIHSFGDLHIYKNHIEQAREQVKRSPYELPRLVLKRRVDSIVDFRADDLQVEGYQYQDKIDLKLNTDLSKEAL